MSTIETLPPDDTQLARVRGAVFAEIAARTTRRRRWSVFGAAAAAIVVIAAGTAGGIAVHQATTLQRNYMGLCYYSPKEVGRGPQVEVSVAQADSGPRLDDTTLHSVDARIQQITDECAASYRLDVGGDAANMNPSLIEVPPITACQEPNGTLAAIVNREGVPTRQFCASIRLEVPHDH